VITAQRSPALPLCFSSVASVESRRGVHHPIWVHGPVPPRWWRFVGWQPAASGFRLLEQPPRSTDLTADELIDPMKGDPDDKATASHHAHRQRPLDRDSRRTPLNTTRTCNAVADAYM